MNNMLCQFSFKNFRSYKDETILDLQAVASSKDESKNFKESLLRGADGKEFLPVSVIYGPNAGGKSNVLKALSCAVKIIMQPILILSGSNVNNILSAACVPFKFYDISLNAPTEFTFFFRPDDQYEYKYFIALQNDKVIEEHMYRKKAKPGSRPSIVFEREQDSIVIGACIKSSKINTQINDSLPYLSFLAINYKLEPISAVINWFEGVTICENVGIIFKQFLPVMLKDPENHDYAIHIMNEVGINISDYQVDDLNNKITVQHNVNNKEFWMNLDDESEGTQKLFALVPLINFALSEGCLLIVDELDAKLHPKLLKYIIMLFKNPEINTHGAQLIFTSHDISTMKSSVFRTDEIWFACKREDESSDLYSLYDIKDENGNHIQPSASFDKQYLEGRYGADPYFRNMMDWK